ncbi:hypothetical protein N2152v2_002133, partial [Parachlorella kessleri]
MLSNTAYEVEVETKTRHEIEDKKQQLRQVVGGSYRDLISSADTIIDIAKSCDHLVGLVGDVQAGLGGLAGGLRERKTSTSEGESNTSYDRLYALGSRVKYLLDTPETIWGCLDSKDYLEASRRYVRSAEVHRALTGHSKHILARFPLLQHQWPLVKKFRSQIWDRAVDWLGSQGELSSEQLASTLLALSLLKPMDGAELLNTYLEARQRYIGQCLESAAAGNPDTDLDTLTVILGDVVVLVYRVVAQCGELFLQLPGVTAAPLLVKVLEQDDLGLQDLAFDTQAGPKSEAAAWKAVQAGVKDRLGTLSPQEVAAQCGAWLDRLSQHFRALGGRLLGSCSSGRDLLAAESGVQEALHAWQFQLDTDSAPAAAAGEPGSAAADAPPPTHALSWNDASQWVLGRPLGLWPLLLEHALVERAKELVARDFTTVVGEVTSLLGGALEEAEELPPAAPGSYQGLSWSDVVVLQPGTPPASAAAAGGAAGRRRRRGSRARRSSSGGAAAAGAGAAGAQAWLPQTERAVQVFDQQLGSALAAALDACYGAPNSSAGPAAEQALAAGAAGAGRKPSGGEYSAGRARVLEPFVQDRCTEAAQAIAAMLESRLGSLPDPPPPDTPSNVAASYAPTAQKTLLVGRFALAIAGRSTALRVILGPPEQWQQHAAGDAGGRGPSGSGSWGGLRLGLQAPSAGEQLLARRLGVGRGASGGLGGAPAPGAPQSAKLAEVQQRFRDLGLRAYSLWADWAAHGLSSALLSSLASDLALVADGPLRGWEETVVPPGAEGTPEAEGDLGGDAGDLGGPPAGEMRFWLPAAPSAAAMALAAGACREADNAGGHAVDEEAVSMLKWRLAGALLGALRSGLQPSGPLVGRGLSEKGVLQLLFDIRFLYDLLAGRGPVSITSSSADGPTGAASAVAARKRELSELEEELQALVDPIDWATYESYLYANKERFTARCQVCIYISLLVGLLGGGAYLVMVT